jgi:membrane-bound metal-dependent hydrolase YbcI (DUF457 family)
VTTAPKDNLTRWLHPPVLLADRIGHRIGTPSFFALAGLMLLLAAFALTWALRPVRTSG